MIRPAAICAVMLALPATAQDVVEQGGARAQDIAEIVSCLSQAVTDELDPAAQCIGVVSGPCIETDEGSTTVGMMDCMGRETLAWDTILNDQWPKLMLQSRNNDADSGHAEADLPGEADTLREAQRAWIAFRDAECAHAYAQGGTGSIRSVYGASCLLDMTARRAADFYLRLTGDSEL